MELQNQDFDSDLRAKDVEIEWARRDAASAKKDAGEANERASASEKEAAGLRKEAETERIARLELEKRIQPRTFDLAQLDDIANPLKRFALGLTGRKITLSSSSGDLEAITFAVETWNVLRRAGIAADASGVGRSIPVGVWTEKGVIIEGRTTDKDFVEALGRTISFHAGKTSVHVEWDSDKHPELSIRVAPKPIYGLPDIVPSK